MKKKGIVYIDGYNWYHAIFKHYPEWKWLNIQSFFEQTRHREEIITIKMFSALMKHDADARDRQEKYFAALRTLPKVQLIMGDFQPRTVTCRANCQKPYVIQDEKKTDVNLAVEMIGDAVNGACEHMIIVTGDSDVQPAVEWIARNRPAIKLSVYVPALPAEQPTRRTDYYTTKNLPVDCSFLPLDRIKDHQFNNMVRLPGADVKYSIRPYVWKKPEPLPQV
ncbi:MAG: NYN domain-containing protein [Verrucomicrobiota bacterium]